MIRFDIEWSFVSPVLQKASGILIVYDIPLPISESTELFRCKCKIEQGSVGVSSFTGGGGIPSKLYDAIQEQIKLMMRSYFDGMLLEKKSFHWIEETATDSFNLDEWIEEKNKNKL